MPQLAHPAPIYSLSEHLDERMQRYGTVVTHTAIPLRTLSCLTIMGDLVGSARWPSSEAIANLWIIGYEVAIRG